MHMNARLLLVAVAVAAVCFAGTASAAGYKCDKKSSLEFALQKGGLPGVSKLLLCWNVIGFNDTEPWNKSVTQYSVQINKATNLQQVSIGSLPYTDPDNPEYSRLHFLVSLRQQLPEYVPSMRLDGTVYGGSDMPASDCNKFYKALCTQSTINPALSLATATLTQWIQDSNQTTKTSAYFNWNKAACKKPGV